MKLNKLIFPAPKSSYSTGSLIGEILYIPKVQSFFCYSRLSEATTFRQLIQKSQNHLNSGSIPCLYLPFSNGSSKLLLYFHGNAEDIGLSYEMLDHMRSALKVNVLAVEYPGYGIYNDLTGCNSEKIREDAEIVF